MIKINTLNWNKGNFTLNATTIYGYTFTSLYLWDAKSYKNYSKAISLADLLPTNSNSLNLTFTLSEAITNQLSQKDKFEDLFFFELISTQFNGTTTKNAVGVIGNLTKYNNCLIDKLLNLNIENCKPTQNFNCSELLDDCNNNICYFNTLLTNICRAISCKYYLEAAILMEKLRSMSENCCLDCDCEQYVCNTISIIDGKIRACRIPLME